MGPPAPPPPAPTAPATPALPQIMPVTVHVEAKIDATHAAETAADAGHEVIHEAVDIVHGVHTSETAIAIDHFLGTAINAATNYLFGPSNSGGSAGTGH